jgi:hypothetical protein
MLDMAARRSEGGVNIKTKTKINKAREESINDSHLQLPDMVSGLRQRAVSCS